MRHFVSRQLRKSLYTTYQTCLSAPVLPSAPSLLFIGFPPLWILLPNSLSPHSCVQVSLDKAVHLGRAGQFGNGISCGAQNNDPLAVLVFPGLFARLSWLGWDGRDAWQRWGSTPHAWVQYDSQRGPNQRCSSIIGVDAALRLPPYGLRTSRWLCVVRLLRAPLDARTARHVPQGRDITQRRRAKHPAVLATELGRARIADLQRRGRGIQALHEHQPPGFV
jgi:hypothetical protein